MDQFPGHQDTLFTPEPDIPEQAQIPCEELIGWIGRFNKVIREKDLLESIDPTFVMYFDGLNDTYYRSQKSLDSMPVYTEQYTELRKIVEAYDK